MNIWSVQSILEMELLSWKGSLLAPLCRPTFSCCQCQGRHGSYQIYSLRCHTRSRACLLGKRQIQLFANMSYVSQWDVYMWQIITYPTFKSTTPDVAADTLEWFAEAFNYTRHLCFQLILHHWRALSFYSTANITISDSDRWCTWEFYGD